MKKSLKDASLASLGLVFQKENAIHVPAPSVRSASVHSASVRSASVRMASLPAAFCMFVIYVCTLVVCASCIHEIFTTA